MSIFNDLFRRAAHDPGVVTFLKEVFIRIPLCLKTNQLVCKEWNEFIKNNIWADQNTRNYLQTFVLEKRQRCGQFKETIVNIDEVYYLNSVGVLNNVMKCD